ncbi:relaxase/mobilization nuclease domain-containing protein [Parapedobacter defluvii]|uniref:relaxase/mobilization nuclease domain-containing protein n=1 Tax=Parapedobacter defluvii TaxID=2045106 RepID=UPI00333E5031
MVAVIFSSNSIRGIFHYNENKVKEGKAVCLKAVNYPLDAADMTSEMKLDRLKKQIELNPRVKVNAVHISLNFDPSERLSESTLKEIAGQYMERIGFGEQPYLLYQHHDAAHPHVHVVSTNIRSNGSRISLHNLGKVQSESARKALEAEYHLVRAEDQKRKIFQIKPVDIRTIQYGKTDTKRAIGNVLASVLNKYAYTSLTELNAVLNLYNIIADGGSKNSRTYQSGGLSYRLLDAKGNKIGVPIKASLFANKPGLKFLEARYAINKTRRKEHQLRLKSAIDRALYLRQSPSLPGMVDELKKQGIDTVIRANTEGRIYGITFVDHVRKTVFNGSYIGKNYSAAGIVDHLLKTVQAQQDNITPALIRDRSVAHFDRVQDTLDPSKEGLLETLMAPEHLNQYTPYYDVGKKKKRKRKQI